MRRAALGLVLIGGCGGEAPQPTQSRAKPITGLPLRPVEVGARPGAASPRLTAGEDAVVLTWLEPAGEGFRLQARALGPESKTQTVTHGDLLQNWADTPSVFAAANGWLAAWPQHRAPSGYDLQWAVRGEDGSWRARGPVSDASAGPEFGFVSWAGEPDGAVRAYWLDGRASTTSHGGAMQLWSARVGSDGIDDRRQVDDRVCDCCQTAASSTVNGPVVVYRDRDVDEVRDIWMAGPESGQRRRVAEDGWQIDGCPVNGPAVAAAGERIAVAWFTGAGGAARVSTAFAQGNAPFTSPVTVDDGDPIGRVDVVWASDDEVVVTWLEKEGTGAALRIRRVRRDGGRGPSATLVSTQASRQAGFPQLERQGEDLLLAWPNPDESSIAVAHLSLAAVPEIRGASGLR